MNVVERIALIDAALAEAGYPHWFAHPCDVPGCDCNRLILSTDLPAQTIPPSIAWRAFYIGGLTTHCFECFQANSDRGPNSTETEVVCDHVVVWE